MATTLDKKLASDIHALNNPSLGDFYFAKDSKNILVSDGSNWQSYSLRERVLGLSNTRSVTTDGLADYLDAGFVNTISGATQVSMGVWFKSTVAGEVPTIGYRPDASNHFALSNPAGTPRVSIRNSTSNDIYIDNAPNDLDWHFYVLTFNAGAVQLYLDDSGLLQLTETGTKPTSLNTVDSSSPDHTFRIGRHGVSNNYGAGFYDEVSLWEGVLNAADVQALYNGKYVNTNLNTFTSSGGASLTHWWRMGDGELSLPSSGDPVISVANSKTSGANPLGVGGGATVFTNIVPNG